MIRRFAAGTALTLLAVLLLFINAISRLLFFRRSHYKTSCRVVMIGTFESPGWLLAHAGPLSACNVVEEVGIVCTAPLDIDLPKIRFYCPSRHTISIFGRRLARIITLVKVAIRIRPHVYIGYHIMPNSLYALLLARVFGGKAIYQMTGGPIQIIGGGYQSENPLLAATGKSSRYLEYLLFSLVRCFDMVIVRGEKARLFVRRHHLAKRCYVITGAINTDIFRPADDPKDIDMIYVGRLVKNKGVEQCVRVAAELVHARPGLHFAIVGAGPLRPKIERLVQECDVERHVFFFGQLANVIPLLQRSKVFVLLSSSEGMSIAMLEAMACGLPVVVADVGDLSDAFAKRPVGVLVDRGCPADIANQINRILENKDLLTDLSLNARKTICEQFSVQAISQRWEEIFSYV